jgi:two-component system, NarL family, sensor kinase
MNAGGILMPVLLAWLRMLLVLVPAVITALATDIPSYSEYVALVLIGLLVIRIGMFKPEWLPLLLPVELLGFGLLASLYEGLLYTALFSGMLAGTMHLRSRRSQGLVSLLSLAVLIATVGSRSVNVQLSAILFWSAFAALLAAYAAVIRKLEQTDGELDKLAGSREKVEASRRQTLDYARQVERHAQTEERGRIARELHDDLGHRMIRLKMMSEAVLQLFEHDPDRAKDLSMQIRDQLEDSMENMRRTVRKLKPAEEGGRRYALDRLIEDAARDLHIEVSFTVSGRPEPLYPSLEFVLYRNAQEAITNAVRHGHASAVAIELAYYDREVRMTVANDGMTAPGRIRQGMGLRGMEERIALLGGRLDITQEDAFRIVTIIPIRDTAGAAEGS